MAFLVFVSVVGGMLLSTALKSGFDRPRPDLVPHGTEVMTASFPSGHAMLATVTYLTLGTMLARAQRGRRRKLFFLTLAVLLALIVGASRVYLGVHWPKRRGRRLGRRGELGDLVPGGWSRAGWGGAGRWSGRGLTGGGAAFSRGFSRGSDGSRAARGQMTAEAIKAFAAQFDPQPFHLDEAAAKDSFFGGLAASGWHTMAVTMRLMVEGGAPIAGGVIGAGGEISWPRPTRPGDVLRVVSTVEKVHAVAVEAGAGDAQDAERDAESAGEVVQVLVANLLAWRRG